MGRSPYGSSMSCSKDVSSSGNPHQYSHSHHHHQQQHHHSMLKKGAWTPEEDQKLIDYINEHGHGNWRALPKKCGLMRCGKSCRLRWTNYLRPDIKLGAFAPSEEQKIIQLHALVGNKWAFIASQLPKRTDNEIKNYWTTVLEKRTQKPPPEAEAVVAASSAITMSVTSSSSSIGGFPSFIEDMKVFQRERLNGHYGVLTFVIANTLSSIPYLFMISLAAGTISYYMAGLHPGLRHYTFFVLTLFASVACVESMMMTIASLVPNYLMGIITGAGILGVFMLDSGFFRLPNDLPKVIWRYPMSYLSFNYWALQGQYKNDLLGLQFQRQDGLPPIPGEQILRQNFQVESRWSEWWDLMVVFINVFAYRVIFFISIKSIPYTQSFWRKFRTGRNRTN